jgi:hypothetical protein
MSENLSQLYFLNLVVTVAMFIVLIFRAWIELRNYRLMWKEIEWRKSCETAVRVLDAEKELFSKVEGGKELYDALSEIFRLPES